MITVKENYMIPVAIFFLSILAVTLMPQKILAEKQTPVRTEIAGGLHTVTVDTEEGQIRIYLPDDMAAGDTISGVVVAEPSGASVQERGENSDELNGYVVDIETGDKETGGTKVKDGSLKKVSIPKELSPGMTKIKVSNPRGDSVANIEIDVKDSPHPLQYTEPPSPGDFKLPRVAKSDEPVQVLGPFDGAFDTSSVTIAGKQARVLAESPRKAVIEIPAGVSGPSEIEVVERGVRAKGEVHIAGANVPASETGIDGMWSTVSGKTVWKITHEGQNVSAETVMVPEQDKIRGYKPKVNILQGSLQGNLLEGKVQQFFLMPLNECMAMCASKCEQWNDIKLILSEDGNTLKGQIQEKAINTETCAVIEFGWIPWTMIRQQ